MAFKNHFGFGKGRVNKRILIIGAILIFFALAAYFYGSTLPREGTNETANPPADNNTSSTEPKVPQGNNSTSENPTNGTVNNQTSSNGNESFGALNVISDPAGAAVFVDTVAYGVTPLTINLSLGSHLVALTKPGYQTDKSLVLINASTVYYINASMIQTIPSNTTPNSSVQTGTLSIYSNPSKATIYIDNKTIGANNITPAQYSNITADFHVISFEKPGYVPYSVRVYVAPGIVNLVEVNLTALDAQFGTLNITTSPEAAEFYLDNKLIGTTPIVYNATVDYHFVRLEKAGFISYNKRFYMTANKVIDVNVTLLTKS